MTKTETSPPPGASAGREVDIQNDIAALLRALGLSGHARPISPHAVVVDEIIPAVTALRSALAAERAAGEELEEIVTTLTLVLPMPPRLTNSSAGRSRHWRSLWKEKQDYWAKLNVMQAAGVFPKPPYPTPDRTEIHARLFLGGQMDHDGAVARMKWPLDWLVANRYIANDNPRHLEWASFPEQVVKRDGNYRVEITLTPL